MAAKIAVSTVVGFLRDNEDKFDLVEWVLFDENTEKVYEKEVAMQNEVKKFEEKYEKNQKEVLVLTERGAGACRIGQEKLWEASVTILAMIDVETNQIVEDKKTLVWLLTDEQCRTEEKIFHIEGQKIYRLKVQESIAYKQDFFGETIEVAQGRSLWVREVMERDCHEERLDAVLAKFQMPVKIKPEGCGELLLDKSLGMFSGDGVWTGCECLVHFDADDENAETAEDAWDTWRKLVAEASKWDEEARAYAAKELVDNANDWLYDSVEEGEEVEEITVEAFARRLEISEVCVSTEGNFELFYDDDDMFWGHVIIVSGNITDGIDDATMAG